MSIEDQSNPAAHEPASSETLLPDHLSADPTSKFYNEAVLERNVGILFNGVEKDNVEEYCVSEGWIRVTAGKAVDRKGRPLLIKLKGKVEPFFKPIA